jgi:hypothetical protein
MCQGLRDFGFWILDYVRAGHASLMDFELVIFSSSHPPIFQYPIPNTQIFVGNVLEKNYY